MSRYETHFSDISVTNGSGTINYRQARQKGLCSTSNRWKNEEDGGNDDDGNDDDGNDDDDNDNDDGNDDDDDNNGNNEDANLPRDKFI